MWKSMEAQQTTRRLLLTLLKEQMGGLEHLEHELTKAEGSMSEKDRKIDELTNLVKDQDRRINSFCAKIDDLEEALAGRKSKEASYKEQIAVLHERNAELINKLNKNQKKKKKKETIAETDKRLKEE